MDAPEGRFQFGQLATDIFPSGLCGLLRGLQCVFRPSENQIGAAGKLLDLRQHGLGRIAAVENQFGKDGVAADAFAPEILGRNQQAIAVVFGQFHIERRTAQKRIIAQYPLAEAVYRVDGGVVELADGSLQAHNQPAAAFLP